MNTQQAIQYELAQVCRRHGLDSDPSPFLSLAPQWIVAGLIQLGVDERFLQPLYSWQQALSDEDVLNQLQSLNGTAEA